MSAALELLIEFTTQLGPTERERIAAWRLPGGGWNTPVPTVVADRILDECHEGHVSSHPHGEVCAASIDLSGEEFGALPVLDGVFSIVPHDYTLETRFAATASRFGGHVCSGRWVLESREGAVALCEEVFGIIFAARVVNLTPHMN